MDQYDNLSEINPVETLVENNNWSDIIYLCEQDDQFIDLLKKNAWGKTISVFNHYFENLKNNNLNFSQQFLQEYVQKYYNNHPVIQDYQLKKRFNQGNDWTSLLSNMELLLLYFYKKSIDFWGEKYPVVDKMIRHYNGNYIANQNNKNNLKQEEQQNKDLGLIFDLVCYDQGWEQVRQNHPDFLNNAVFHNQYDLVEKLINKGWSVNQIDQKGDPVSFYVQKPNMLSFLSQYNPVLTNYFDSNRTILDIIESNSKNAVKQQFMQVLIDQFEPKEAVKTKQNSLVKENLVANIHKGINKKDFIELFKQADLNHINESIQYKNVNAPLLGHVLYGINHSNSNVRTVGQGHGEYKSRIAIAKYLLSKKGDKPLLNQPMVIHNQNNPDHSILVNQLTYFIHTFYGFNDFAEEGFIDHGNLMEKIKTNLGQTIQDSNKEELVNQIINDFETLDQFKTDNKNEDFIFAKREQFFKQAQFLWTIAPCFNMDKNQSALTVIDFLHNKTQHHYKNKSLIASIFEETKSLRLNIKHLYFNNLHQELVHNNEFDLEVKDQYMTCLIHMLNQFFNQIEDKQQSLQSIDTDEMTVGNNLTESIKDIIEANPNCVYINSFHQSNNNNKLSKSNEMNQLNQKINQRLTQNQQHKKNSIYSQKDLTEIEFLKYYTEKYLLKENNNSIVKQAVSNKKKML